MTSIETSR